jgi:hypothetical protein
MFTEVFFWGKNGNPGGVKEKWGGERKLLL